MSNNNADAYFRRGNDYYWQHQLQDALDSYKHALRLKPDYADAYINMGVVYSKQDQLQDALDSY